MLLITPYHWQEESGELVAGVTATLEIEVANNNANCELLKYIYNG